MLTNAKPLRHGARRAVTGSIVAAGCATVLAVVSGLNGCARTARADGVPPVETFELGHWTLHVARDPFRISWLHDGKVARAERFRRKGSSIELSRGGRWTAAGAAKSIDRRASDRIDAQLDIAGGGAVSVELLVGSSGADSFARWTIDSPGADEVQDDIVPASGEQLFAVPGSPMLVLSSSGCAMWVAGAEGAKVEALRPDPDGFRLKARGSRLAIEVWKTSPKEALLRAQHASPRSATSAPPGVAPLEVKSWTTLRAAVDSLLADSLASSGTRAIVLSGDATAGELLARAQSVVESFRSMAERRPQPLLVEFPEEREAWQIRDAWLVGSDTLVAPVLREGESRRRVWLPPGEWRRQGEPAAEAAPRAGPIWIDAEAPPGTIAIYKKGTVPKKL